MMTTRTTVRTLSRPWTGPPIARVCCDSVGGGPSGTGPVDVYRETPRGATCSMGHDQSGAALDLRDYLGIGTFNLVCVLAGMGLGWWADASVGLTPVLTLLGLVAGVGVGVWGSWLRLRPLLRDGVAGPGNGTDHG